MLEDILEASERVKDLTKDREKTILFLAAALAYLEILDEEEQG